MLLVIYSAFSLPVVLCFDVDTSATAGWDLFVDVVFYCDVVIYFFTAYGPKHATESVGESIRRPLSLALSRVQADFCPERAISSRG